MTYYKVVRKWGDSLVSAVTTGDWQVEYIPDRWVDAPIGKLFVFRTEDQAHQFSINVSLTTGCSAEVWEAQAQGVQEIDEDRAMLPILSQDFMRYWQEGKAPNRGTPLPGTILAKSVRITRKLWPKPEA
jgi:hypothetical protein